MGCGGWTYADDAVRTGFLRLLALFPYQIDDQNFDPGSFQEFDLIIDLHTQRQYVTIRSIGQTCPHLLEYL